MKIGSSLSIAFTIYANKLVSYSISLSPLPPSVCIIYVKKTATALITLTTRGRLWHFKILEYIHPVSFILLYYITGTQNVNTLVLLRDISCDK